jgi:hypothetical protein
MSYGPFDGFGYSEYNEKPSKTDLFYQNVEDIKSVLYKIFYCLIVIAFFFAILIVAVVFTCAIIWSHRSVLSDIEEKTDEILDAVNDFLSTTFSMTKDIDNSYKKAKEIHLRRMKEAGEDPSNSILFADNDDDNNGKKHHNNNNNNNNNNDDDHSYLEHFMNVLLQVIPLHDEKVIIARLTTAFDAVDAFNHMIIQANQSGIITNTSTLEYNINRVLGNDKTKEVANNAADLSIDIMKNKEKIIDEYGATKDQLKTTLTRADALINTPVMDKIIHNNNVIKGIGHLGKNVDEVLSQIIKFGHTSNAKEIAGNVVDIIGAINHFHGPKYASQVLMILANLGARTAGMDLPLSDSINGDQSRIHKIGNGGSDEIPTEEGYKKDAVDELNKWME